MYINKSFLCGRVGKNPEIFEGQNFTIARFSIATKIFYKKNNENQSRTIWHKIVVYNNKHLIELVKKHVLQGAEVYVEGFADYSVYKDEKSNTNKTNSFIVAKNIQISKFKEEAEKENVVQDSNVQDDVSIQKDAEMISTEHSEVDTLPYAG